MRKGLWSPDEDEKLRKCIAARTNGSWNDIARIAGLQRCGKSCRRRWMNHLRPDLKHDRFTPDEIRLVLRLHHKFGNKWSEIAAHLVGRTDNDVKNLWNTRIKKKLLLLGGKRANEEDILNDPLITNFIINDDSTNPSPNSQPNLLIQCDGDNENKSQESPQCSASMSSKSNVLSDITTNSSSTSASTEPSINDTNTTQHPIITSKDAIIHDLARPTSCTSDAYSSSICLSMFHGSFMNTQLLSKEKPIQGITKYHEVPHMVTTSYGMRSQQILQNYGLLSNSSFGDASKISYNFMQEPNPMHDIFGKRDIDNTPFDVNLQQEGSTFGHESGGSIQQDINYMSLPYMMELNSNPTIRCMGTNEQIHGNMASGDDLYNVINDYGELLKEEIDDEGVKQGDSSTWSFDPYPSDDWHLEALVAQCHFSPCASKLASS